MNLKTITPQTSKRVSIPKIIFYAAGTMFLNKELCENMKLKPGDGVIFHQDEDNPTEWYIEKDDNGFKLRTHGKAKSELACSSQATRKLLFDSIDCIKESFTFPVSKQPVIVDNKRLFPIFTSSYKQSL